MMQSPTKPFGPQMVPSQPVAPQQAPDSTGSTLMPSASQGAASQSAFSPQPEQPAPLLPGKDPKFTQMWEAAQQKGLPADVMLNSVIRGNPNPSATKFLNAFMQQYPGTPYDKSKAAMNYMAYGDVYGKDGKPQPQPAGLADHVTNNAQSWLGTAMSVFNAAQPANLVTGGLNAAYNAITGDTSSPPEKAGAIAEPIMAAGRLGLQYTAEPVTKAITGKDAPAGTFDTKRDVGSVAGALPTVLGGIGSMAGPEGTGMGVGAGSYINNQVQKGLQQGGVPEPKMSDIVAPAAEGITAGVAHVGINKVTDMIGSMLAKKGDEVVQMAAQPQETKKVLQSAFTKNPNTLTPPTALSAGEINNTPFQQKIADVVGNVPGVRQAKNVIEAGQAIYNNGIVPEAQAIEAQLQPKGSQILVNNKNLGKLISETQKADVRTFFANEKTVDSNYKGIVNIWTDVWNKAQEEGGNNVLNLWKARQAFDDHLESQFGTKIFDPLKDTPRSAAVRNVREAVNKYIDSQSASLGADFGGAMERMSAMYRGLENMSSHLDTSHMQSRLVRLLTNPKTKAVAIGTAGLAGAGTLATTAHKYLMPSPQQ